MGPDLQMVGAVFDLVAVQIVHVAVRGFRVGPLNRLASVAVCEIESVLLIRRFQRDGHMPDLPAVIAYPEEDVPRPDLGQVIQLARGVASVPEDEGADHAGVGPAAVGVVDAVAPHDPSALCTGNLVFVGTGCLIRSPHSVGGPVPLDLPQELQHVFLRGWDGIYQVVGEGTAKEQFYPRGAFPIVVGENNSLPN